MWSGRLAKAGGGTGRAAAGRFGAAPSGEVALDPDEQAQAAIRLVFGLFDRLGT